MVLGQVEVQNASRPNNSIRVTDSINLKFRVENKNDVTMKAVQIKVDNDQKGVEWTGVELGDELINYTKGEDLPTEHPIFETIRPGGHEIINYIYHLNSDFNDHKVRFTISGTTESGKGNWVEKKHEDPVIISPSRIPIAIWISFSQIPIAIRVGVGGIAIFAIILAVAKKNRGKKKLESKKEIYVSCPNINCQKTLRLKILVTEEHQSKKITCSNCQTTFQHPENYLP